MKRFLTLVLLLASACAVRSQSFTPTVVASGGTYASNGSNSLSYTIGELAVTTLSSTGNFLTQGFQQPDDKGVGVTHLSLPNLQVKLYPNPATESLSLWIKCEESVCNDLRVSIHDLLGREIIVQNEMLNNGSEKLYSFNVKSLAASMYFVRLQDQTGSFTKVIKFNKTSL